MKSENYIKLEFPSRSVNEGFARAAAAAFAAQLDPTLEELGDIKTAVSEAVTNCTVHAYPDSLGRVMLRLRIMKGGRLEIVVKDWGRGIEDVKKAREPLFTTAAPSAAAWASPSWRASWTSSASAPRRAGAPRSPW